MKNNDIRSALPQTPESVRAGVQAAIGRIQRKEAGSTRSRIRPGRLAALVAAAALVLVAAGFTVAAATGAFARAKEESAAVVETFEYEKVKADWKQVNWTPWALVNATGTVNGTDFTLTESMLYKQNAPDYYLSAQVFYDPSVKNLCPNLDTFTMTVDGRVLSYDAFCIEQWNVGGIWEDGHRYFDLAFLYEDSFPVGSDITLSGTLHTYDGDGNQTGVYGDLVITYTLTQEMVDAMTEKNSAEMADAEKQALEASNAAVQQLPDTVTVINGMQGDVTLHEISYENGRFFFSLTLPQGTMGVTPALNINGIPMAASVLYAEGEDMAAYTYYCSAALSYGQDALTAPWVVALTPDLGAINPWFIFRFDPASGKATLPTDEEYPAWVAEWQAMGNELPTVFDIQDEKTVGGVTVTVDRLEYSCGKWILYTYLSGMADYHTPQEYAPVLTAGGASAVITNAYERYEYLEPQSDGMDQTPVFWEMDLPLTPDADGRVRLVIDWPIYDRAADGTAFVTGTYTLDQTF